MGSRSKYFKIKMAVTSCMNFVMHVAWNSDKKSKIMIGSVKWNYLVFI